MSEQKHWRPDICKDTENCVAGVNTPCAVCQKIQDAMLAALRVSALRVNNIGITNRGKGTIVFIPDDEESSK